MKEAIVLFELKDLPEKWTKEDVASYLDRLLKSSNPRYNFAAIKIFEVSE